MSKKSVLIILIISVAITYLLPFITSLLDISNNGDIGFPFRYATVSFFGGSSFNYTNFLLDVASWFIMIWVMINVIKKIAKK